MERKNSRAAQESLLSVSSTAFRSIIESFELGKAYYFTARSHLPGPRNSASMVGWLKDGEQCPAHEPPNLVP